MKLTEFWKRTLTCVSTVPRSSPAISAPANVSIDFRRPIAWKRFVHLVSCQMPESSNSDAPTSMTSASVAHRVDFRLRALLSGSLRCSEVRLPLRRDRAWSIASGTAECRHGSSKYLFEPAVDHLNGFRRMEIDQKLILVTITSYITYYEDGDPPVLLMECNFTIGIVALPKPFGTMPLLARGFTTQ